MRLHRQNDLTFLLGISTNSDMSLQWLASLILISSYFTIVCLNAESPCVGSGFNGSTSEVCGVVGENINLACNVPTNCGRVFWKHDDTINGKWLMPGMDVGPNYHLSYSPSQALNSLRITNLSNSLAGFYTCLCGDNQSNTAFACFNLSVLCDISVQINYENRVFDTCNVTREKEMIAVKSNENISIKCEDDINLFSRNCLQKEKKEAFTVDMAHHMCSFSCISEAKRKCQAKWITLNVTDYSTSSSTEMTRNYQTPKLPSSSTTSSSQTLTLSSSQTFSSPGPLETKLRTSNENSAFMTSGTPSHTLMTSLPTSTGHTVSSTKITSPKQITKSISSTSRQVQNTICVNSSVEESTQLGTTFQKNTNNNLELTVSTSGTTSQENTSGVPSTTVPIIIVVSCIIFVLSFIVIILCIHIICYKIGIRSCNNKEEWTNPLYESADNRAELPIVIPDGGNIYNTINSPDDLTKLSSPECASNNVHQIDLDLGRTKELPMVQLKASENVEITATPFGAHSMELNKSRCKQVDTSLTAADEALKVPTVGDVSPPPASPHFYEMFK